MLKKDVDWIILAQDWLQWQTFLDHDNDTFGSVKDRKLLQQLSHAQLVKINSAS
jgi:hypothetical protein